MRARVVWTIFRKEITESLRDRVTLLVLIGLPLLIYPLSLVTITQVTKRQSAVEDRQVASVAVWGVGAEPMLDWLAAPTNRLKLERWRGMPSPLRRDLEAGRLQPGQTPPPAAPRKTGLAPDALAALHEPASSNAVLRAARDVVTGRQADAVLILWPGFDDAKLQHGLGHVSVYYDSVLPNSTLAWERLSGGLEQYRLQLLKERQRERSLPDGFVTALVVRGDDVAPPQRQLRNLLGRVLPLVLIMLAVTGAIVAATDLTAGEKDRATMQTLLCAPVHSIEIVAGKFLTVWGISLLSAVANITGIGVTLWRLTAALNENLVSLGFLATVGALLLPATWTIAALFLAVAALARDAKDAGNFLGAAAFAVMIPVGATFLPGVELDPWTCCVPLVNLALLIRALMAGAVAPHLLLLTLVLSLAYAGLALALAARVFGREQILLGGPLSWRGLLFSGSRQPAGPTPGFALLLFPLAIAGLFYVGLALASRGLLATLLGTQLGVLLLPVVSLALVRKFPLAETFSLRRPHWRSVVGAALIGVSASVAIGGIVLRLAPPPDSMLREMQDLLRLGDTQSPLWQLVLVMALTPAVCEETFFRGMMLSGLRRWGPWVAIGLTALFFGLLHGSVYRLLPTFVLGLVLGYAVWRSGSLFCSVIIHALNNSLIVFIVWKSPANAVAVNSIPWSLTLGALAVLATGLTLLTGPSQKAGSPIAS
jgi:sodium transport system permease protein